MTAIEVFILTSSLATTAILATAAVCLFRKQAISSGMKVGDLYEIQAYDSTFRCIIIAISGEYCMTMDCRTRVIEFRNKNEFISCGWKPVNAKYYE